MAPTISVLLPAFDSERPLETAVRSILNQTYRDLELIIIDDGSTDRTRDVAQALSQEDARVRVVPHNENRGLAARLNEGLSLAQGKFVARMDADDVSLPRRLELQISYLESHPDIALVGGFIRFFGGKRSCTVRVATEPLHIRWRLLFGNSIGHVTVLAHREFFNDLGGYDETLRVAQDYDLWLRARDRFLMSNIPQVLVDVREDPFSTARRLGIDRQRNALQALNRTHNALLDKDVPLEVSMLCMDPASLRTDESLTSHVQEAVATIEALLKTHLVDAQISHDEAVQILSDARYKLAQLVLLSKRKGSRSTQPSSAFLRRRDLVSAIWKFGSHKACQRLRGCP